MLLLLHVKDVGAVAAFELTKQHLAATGAAWAGAIAVAGVRHSYNQRVAILADYHADHAIGGSLDTGALETDQILVVEAMSNRL